MQRAALLTRQPTINLSYINLDPVITEVSQCPSLLAAELKIRAAFYWLKDLRSHPEFHRMEKRLEDACRGVCRQLPTDLRCGAFVLYCFLCPISLLSKRLQDDLWLNELEDLLRSSKSRQLTCEALLSLALLECDSRKALRRLVVILSEVPEQNLVGGTVAQAASEVILASLNAVQEALADDVVRIAHEVMEDELRRDPPPLPQLHGIFRFLRLSLWAAHNAGIRFEGLIAEQLPILLAVSRSKCAGIRSLAVAALTSLVPSDGPFDRYMVTQARACPLGANEHPNGFRANVSWQGPDESPFEAFLATSPTTDTYRAVMARFYAGHDGATDWRSLAFALVEIIEDPDSLSALGLETNPNIPGTHFPAMEDITDVLVEAMVRTSDSEAATILRLRAALAKGSYMDALVQAREAVQSHPTCAFAHCVLSLFPDYVEGLKAAKKGLACMSDDESPMLRRWFLRRVVVHAGVQGLSLAGSNLCGEERDALLGAALLESALEAAETLLRTRHDQGFPGHEQILVCYILLSVARHGTHLPSSTTSLLKGYGLDSSLEKLEDRWLQFTPYSDLEASASRYAGEWSGVVDRIDNLITNTIARSESATGDHYLRASKRTWPHFCLWCNVPTAVVVNGAYCDEGCKVAHVEVERARSPRRRQTSERF